VRCPKCDPATRLRPWSDRDVLYVYRDKPDGSLYVTATLCLASGKELTRRVLIAALDAKEAGLDDTKPPPLASRSGGANKPTGERHRLEKPPLGVLPRRGIRMLDRFCLGTP
jgi:hypothetical protein